MVEKKTKVHFIGINGSGISGVACIAKNKGFDVDGCDTCEKGDYTKQLLDNNIQIFVGHNEEHLKDADIVVLSPALLYKDRYKNIEETKVAMETKKTIKWQKFLGDYIMKKQNVVAVAGTHGKTTITSLIGLILEKANFDPTTFVGGVVKEWGTTYRVGNSNYYVCEADEYDGNFLNYSPKYVILNNIEMEHPERFNNYKEYEDNFRQFLELIQENGKLVFNFDDENSLNLVNSMLNTFKRKNIDVIAFTLNKTNKKVLNGIKLINADWQKNKVIINNNEFEYKLLGEHNAKNVAITSILAMELGVNVKTIQNVIADFNGSKRRMDLVFSNDKVKLYDDYAHHHTQIHYTIKALKDNLSSNEKLIAILEPHLISRIKDNVEEFRQALLLADFPIITKVFKSREDFLPDLDVKTLINNEKIEYIEDFENVVERVKDIISQNSKNNFSIIVMGAGKSYNLTNSLKEVFNNNSGLTF